MSISKLLLILSLLAGVSGCAGMAQNALSDNARALATINAAVNRDIRYEEEPYHWVAVPRRDGTVLHAYLQEDVWRLPTDGAGDCEDFALEKLRRARERLGLPGTVLAYTIRQHGKTVAHAVAVIDGWILDNRFNRLRPFARPEGPWREYLWDFAAKRAIEILSGKGERVQMRWAVIPGTGPVLVELNGEPIPH